MNTSESCDSTPELSLLGVFTDGDSSNLAMPFPISPRLRLSDEDGDYEDDDFEEDEDFDDMDGDDLDDDDDDFDDDFDDDLDDDDLDGEDAYEDEEGVEYDDFDE